MDYEKKYKEALERAKKLGTSEMPLDPKRNFAEQIFPELVESEDEKIRKGLIEYFSFNKDGSSHALDNITPKQIVTWLEKQGEKDSQVTLPTFTFDDILALECCMKEVEKKDEKLYNQLQSLHNRVHDAYWLEKQGKKKIVDINDIKEKAHQIAWETSKHYDPNSCKQEWCEMAALDMALWLEKGITTR